MPSPAAIVSVRAIVVCACLVMAAPGLANAGQDHNAAADVALPAFDARIARSAALRTKFEAALPAFDDPRRDSWTLLLARRYLASAMRTARRPAEQGCIFGPAAEVFRDTITGALDEIDMEGLVDEGGASALALDLTLNEPIPAWALSPLPGPLLEGLPPLPAAIEYRIAGGALILWDTHAEILIDALPDAFVALPLLDVGDQ